MFVNRFAVSLTFAVVAGLCLGLMLMPLSHTSAARSAADDSKADDRAIHGFDPANLDRACKPCDDFYKFAAGGWMKSHPIPPEYSSWGSFTMLSDKNQEALHQILEEAAKNNNAARGSNEHPRDSNEKKIGDYYAACMDEAGIEAQGLKPIQPELARIAAISGPAELQSEVARLQAEGAEPMFRFGSGQDLKNSSMVIAEADQGGLGLPERDYYTRDDQVSKTLREQYVKHVAKMFELLGDPAEKAAGEAATVMTIETALAKASMSNVDLRNPDKIYHKMTLEQLKELTPGFSWESYFRNTGHPELREANVAQPDFFKELNRQLTATPLDDWKSYLRWRLLDRSARALPAKFVAEDFEFSGRTLTGAKQIQPRWKRCVQSTDRALGEALGQIYVAKYFTPETKAHALEMVHNLIAALRDDLRTLEWMGPETRKHAAAKLEAFGVKIGYPDKWRDYSPLQIDRSSYLQNQFHAAQFDSKRRLAKIGRPVDRTEWGMTPPTVNAYNRSSMNEIVFPAGIMQPPFYDPKADDAVNYGGMGAVIGHEITHGFDDHGSKFDGQGNLNDWWSPEDKKNFDARATCVVEQFNGYVVEGDLHQNGKLVLGESIADLGGLAISYAAFEKSLQGKSRPKEIDGFTPEQRFFLGWAQVWATNARPEYERLQANTNPHPLSRFRTNGPLSNFPAFAAAFGCKKGEPMVRENACRIW
jgi:predicted metalloendopeptidase